MFTKTTLALAVILGTASNALAATRHRSVAPSREASMARIEKAPLSRFCSGLALAYPPLQWYSERRFGLYCGARSA
jgi:hypothetical protein